MSEFGWEMETEREIAEEQKMGLFRNDWVTDEDFRALPLKMREYILDEEKRHKRDLKNAEGEVKEWKQKLEDYKNLYHSGVMRGFMMASILGGILRNSLTPKRRVGPWVVFPFLPARPASHFFKA